MGQAHGRRLWRRRILMLVAAATAVFYLGLPIIVKVGTRSPSQLELEVATVEPSRQPSESAQVFLDETARALDSLGFVLAGQARLTNLSGEPYMAVYVNRRAEEMAAVMVYSQKLGSAPPTEKTTVSFLTVTSSGERAETSNMPELPILAEDPTQDVVRLPTIRDPLRLHAIHRARTNRGKLKGRPPEAGDELAWVKQDYAVDMAHQVSAGLWEEAVEAGVLQPTWKGAYLMTWRLIPPGSWLVRARQRYENSRLLGELGLD